MQKRRPDEFQIPRSQPPKGRPGYDVGRPETAQTGTAQTGIKNQKVEKRDEHEHDQEMPILYQGNIRYRKLLRHRGLLYELLIMHERRALDLEEEATCYNHRRTYDKLRLSANQGRSGMDQDIQMWKRNVGEYAKLKEETDKRLEDITFIVDTLRASMAKIDEVLATGHVGELEPGWDNLPVDIGLTQADIDLKFPASVDPWNVLRDSALRGIT